MNSSNSQEEQKSNENDSTCIPQKNLKAIKWTKNEDAQLKSLVSSFGEENWDGISNHLPNHTSNECSKRWTKILKPGLVKGPWSQSEDKLLMQWVRSHGCKQWSICANQIPGRTGKQCRERWINSLNPKVKRGKWTDEDQIQILQQFRTYGSSWSSIAKQIGNRTENSIKNYFYSTIRKLQSDKLGGMVKEYLNTIEENNKSKAILIFNQMKLLLNKLAEEMLKFVSIKDVSESEKVFQEELINFLRNKPGQNFKEKKNFLVKRQKFNLKKGTVDEKEQPDEKEIKQEFVPKAENNENLSNIDQDKTIQEKIESNNQLMDKNYLKSFGPNTSELLGKYVADMFQSFELKTINVNKCPECMIQDQKGGSYDHHHDSTLWQYMHDGPYREVVMTMMNELKRNLSHKISQGQNQTSNNVYGFTINPNWSGGNSQNLTILKEQLKKMSKIKDLIVNEDRPSSRQVENMLYAKLMEVEKIIINSYKMATNMSHPLN